MKGNHSHKRALRRLIPISLALAVSLAVGNVATAATAEAATRNQAQAAVAAVPGVLPSCGTVEQRQNTVQNKDCSDVHLVMQKITAAPNPEVLTSMLTAAGLYAAGDVLSPITTPIMTAIFGPLFPLLGWVALAYTAVIFALDIPELIQYLEGGTVDSVGRRSGYCQNVWETVARVHTAKAGASTSVDLFWVSKGRSTTSYIRYLFAYYLGRQPSCGELRSELAKFYPGTASSKMFSTEEDRWSDAIAQNVLTNIACDAKAADGVRWSTKVATQQGNTMKATSIAKYCGHVDAGKSEPWKAVQLSTAGQIASQGSERCSTDTVPSPRLTRNSIQIADPPGQFDDLDDLFFSIGRPPESMDAHKTGRVVNTFTVNAVMGSLPKTYSAWVDYVYAGKTALTDSSRDLACAWAGPWIQVADRGVYGTFANVLNESDQVLRDYADIKVGQPIGYDALGLVAAKAAGMPEGSRLRVNMFNVFSALVDGNCSQTNVNPADSLKLNEQRTVCRPGDLGHAAIAELVTTPSP